MKVIIIISKENNVALSIMKHKANNKIKKRKTPFNLKPKRLFDEISLEMELICHKLK